MTAKVKAQNRKQTSILSVSKEKRRDHLLSRVILWKSFNLTFSRLSLTKSEQVTKRGHLSKVFCCWRMEQNDASVKYFSILYFCIFLKFHWFQLEYGTIFCYGSNMVGRQESPCVFHIIPASEFSLYNHLIWQGKTYLKSLKAKERWSNHVCF